MSPRRAGPPSGGAPSPLLSLLAVAAALIGGLAAADIVHASTVVTLVVSLVVAGIAIFALFRWPSSPVPIERGDHDGSRRAPVPPPDPVWQNTLSPAPIPPPGPVGEESGAKTTAQVFPANPQAPEESWWKLAPKGPPPPSPGARRVPAPDLSTYLSATQIQIAQCPNCGAFGLEMGEVRGGWGFRCESCEHTWAWRPGMPWPPIRVAPRRRTRAQPPP
jgi:hypothetical protein